MTRLVFAPGRLTTAIALVALLILSVSPTLGAEQVALIAGNHSPSIERLVAPKRAPADQVLAMGIELTPARRAELDRLLAGQQDRSSPLYHRWLRRGEFDQRFGPNPALRAAISRWLEQRGFVIKSGNDHFVIGFTGTVLQAEQAFSVAIESSDGGTHYANLNDPSVPMEFVNYIAFVGGLDNLPGAAPTVNLVPGSPADQAGKPSVDSTNSPSGLPAAIYNNFIAFGPSDLYTFYDENPLLNAGVNGEGGGCIGLIEVGDYSDQAIENFDQTFNLPTANLTRIVSLGSRNPGQNSRSVETMADIEYAHATAPGAAINVYLTDPDSYAGNLVSATMDSLKTAVDQDTCSALSISIESCAGLFPNSFYTGALHTIYMKAASQGQTVLVSEGDQGAAAFSYDPSTLQCSNGTRRQVSELASDPFVTSIGGTQFKPEYDVSDNDVGFVAESVWNEPQLGAGGGGASIIFKKPDFQQVATPNDGARDVPDISLEAACEDPGVYVSLAPVSSSENNPICCFCGTSLGAPIWAGITELLVQSNKEQRVGTLNPQLYELGSQHDTTATGIRDVTMGNNDFNGVVGFDAVPGFDLASGWGTPDIATFVPAFLATPPPPKLTELNASPAKLNFGNVHTNGTSKQKKVTLTNNGTAKAQISTVTATVPFTIAGAANTCSGGTIVPKKTCAFDVEFAPATVAGASGGINVIYNGTSPTVALSGNGIR